MLHPCVVRTAFGAEDQAMYFMLPIPLMWRFMKTAAERAEARYERDARGSSLCEQLRVAWRI